MRTFARMLLGLFAAAVASSSVLVLLATVRGGGVAGASGGDAVRLVLSSIAATLMFLIPVGLPLAAAGALLRLSSLRAYVMAGGAAGLTAILIQWSGERPGGATIANPYGVTAFLIAGFTGGALYWLLARPRSEISE